MPWALRHLTVCLKLAYSIACAAHAWSASSIDLPTAPPTTQPMIAPPTAVPRAPRPQPRRPPAPRANARPPARSTPALAALPDLRADARPNRPPDHRAD